MAVPPPPAHFFVLILFTNLAVSGMIIEKYFPIPICVGNLAIAANPMIFPVTPPLKTLTVAWI